MKPTKAVILCGVLFVLASCKKKKDPPPVVNPMVLSTWNITNNSNKQTTYYDASVGMAIRFRFNAPVKRSTVTGMVTMANAGGGNISCNISYEASDSVIVLKPASNLSFLTKYKVSLVNNITSAAGGALLAGTEVTLYTSIDSSRKFPVISDNALLDLVQQQTFKYFWDFGHPVSGLARERNSSGDIVTSGGSGFGIMAMVTGVSRNFITRAQGLTRMQTIVSFLKNTAQKFHGAFPHWLNGATGTVVPFSTKDNGADLVETAYLMEGLLCARQYFNDPGVPETNLRNDINTIWNGVEWDWFRHGGQNVLYWHWSPDYNWDMNMPIRGWNECLITYVLAAASTTHGVPATVYSQGWTGNGSAGFTNGGTYNGVVLPLGPAGGGPLFFEHYSFLGIKPVGLNDAYANYQTQTVNHSRINYEYCRSNPNSWFGYSDSVWGLTASDIQNGYTASSPTNDIGTIAPTAALSSFPYTPTESMKALKYFYYVLGDKIWGDYGFYDAFNLKDLWFANSYLAIDQGPIIVMIENYRSGLMWNLFTSCPEVKAGMLSLGFTAPYL